ncbi:MAG: NapC/NirT family cytochrome c [Actinomycetota bacterium]|nr:NapC/NirT family cytochrome c [Actinomycetota bacterium]
MDKDQYDRPENEDTVWSRGLGLLLGAVAIVVIFWVIFNTGLLK